MKVSILLLAVVFCLAAVNASTSEEEEFFNSLSDKSLSDDIAEFQVVNIFSTFFWYLKSALRTLKGINCTIKQVIVIKGETEVFLRNIQYCGSDAVNAFGNVITSAQLVLTTCNDIINLNTNVCTTDESTNGTPKTCKRQLFKQIYKLQRQISKLVATIKKVPAIPGEAANCSNSAANELSIILTSLPSTVKTCSKLKN